METLVEEALYLENQGQGARRVDGRNQPGEASFHFASRVQVLHVGVTVLHRYLGGICSNNLFRR